MDEHERLSHRKLACKCHVVFHSQVQERGLCIHELAMHDKARSRSAPVPG
jgi:hypothetical protein